MQRQLNYASKSLLFPFCDARVEERTGSTLARLVLIIWLFVVLVLNSSYIASLTSILTVEQLSSPVKGIESLVTNNEPIGFLQGSFAEKYLTDELNIHRSRLVPLNSPEEYDRALKAGPGGGGVAAIIDERAYMELFLSIRCQYSIVGQEFTKMGWGFVSIHTDNLCTFASPYLTCYTSYRLRRNPFINFFLFTGISPRLATSNRHVNGHIEAFGDRESSKDS